MLSIFSPLSSLAIARGTSISTDMGGDHRCSSSKHEPSPLVDGLVLARLKETTSDFVFIDPDAN